MARLLYIEASPRKDRSASIRVAQAYIEAHKKSHPEDIVDTIDLWNTELPAFDGDVINAKYAILHGEQHSEVQKKAWEAVEEVIANFKTADRYLFSLPMWNFGIPYRLKHFIDVLVQPGYTFSFSQTEGYKGMVTENRQCSSMPGAVRTVRVPEQRQWITRRVIWNKSSNLSVLQTFSQLLLNRHSWSAPMKRPKL
jgi:FMN-dependent NADH-azoreductase